MGYIKLETLRKEKESHRDFMLEFVNKHLLSPNLTSSDRMTIVKLMKQQYREGFLNGMKLVTKNQ